jgi:aminoglycoside phosphotransferase (APT) family kinase protein
MRLHDGEPHVDLPLVRALVDAQFPGWAALPLRTVPATGTDHWLFRLGDDLVVRVPRIGWATEQAALEARWLPVLAPHLVVSVPEHVAVGAPANGYPWTWSVCRWIPGRTPDRTVETDLLALAGPLGEFCAALRTIDVTGGPVAGDGLSRGAPLIGRDAQTREAILEVADEWDALALAAEWDAALEVPAYDGPGCWLHGDLLAGNLLIGPGSAGDTLVAVIDWGPLAVGDPAADAAAAWGLLSSGTREEFRSAAAYDDPTWARGRGWALTTALSALAYYRTTSPSMSRQARLTLTELLSDHRTPATRS